MYIRTYEQAQRYLESLIPDPEVKRKGNMRLERIEHLLSLLGNPEKRFKSIHIGGTSGKGSTAYLVSSFLANAGYRAGLHISPHLQVLTERMQTNNQFISEEEFVKLVNDIQPLVDEVEGRGVYGKPSYFEVLVALSFQYFAIEKVDIAIIEVGLGGKLDATNVIYPLVAVITNVEFDHTEILGDTIEKIAQDKVGIIKEGIEVITGATQLSVVDIIKKQCKEKEAHLTKIKPRGLFQEQNAKLAIEVLRTLEKYGFFVSEEVIAKTLKSARFAGRLEVVEVKPLHILDGAHNPAKMRALVKALQQNFPKRKFASIVAFKKTKDIKGILKELLPITKLFIFTMFHVATDSGYHMAASPEDIAKIAREIAPTIPFNIEPNIGTLPNEPTLITGSLYLVGEMRNRCYPWQTVLKNRNWYSS